MTVEENPLPAEFLEHLVEIIWDNLDLGLLWAAGTPSGFEQSLPFPEGQILNIDKSAKCQDRPTIAVARDNAFCFVYEDNLRLLREAGAEIVEFSPLRDAKLPEGIAGIYLPGGYPELFADTLADNAAMKAELRMMIERGMPVYAECGGFIYLTKGVVADPWSSPQSDGRSETVEQPASPIHDFVGIFPVTTRMLSRRKALGYREVKFTADSILGPAGMVARGHEFHYSEMGEMPARIKRSYRVSKNDIDLGTEGYRSKNCLASYLHLHFGSCPGMAAAFVESCRKYNKAGGRVIKAKRKTKTN
jgi:cobyrinic acid a,c-diamide synthase